ncbi:hypothetical protein Tco_0256349 [Tanacetum coccineum]
MTDSLSQNPSSPNKVPREEPVFFYKPKIPNPFLPPDKVNFTFNEITFSTNNVVALLYPEHTNSEYFKQVSDFISNCCLKEAFTIAPTQYEEYLAEFWYTAKNIEGSNIWVSTPTRSIKGEISLVKRLAKREPLKRLFFLLGGKSGGHDQISNKDAILLYCPSNGVKVDFAKIIWDDLLNKLNKKTREKVVPYHRFVSILLEYMMPEYADESLTVLPTEVFSAHNWALKQNQPKGPPLTDHMLAICQIGVSTDQQAPNTSPQAEKKEPPVKEELTLISVVISQLKLIPKIFVPNDSILPYQDTTKSVGDRLNSVQNETGINEGSSSKNIKLEDLAHVMYDTRSVFFSKVSSEEPIIVTDDSEMEEPDIHEDTQADYHDETEDTPVPPPPSPKSILLPKLQARVQTLRSHKLKLEEEKAKAKAEAVSLRSQSKYLDINKLTELLVTSLKPIVSKLLATHDFSSFIPTELKTLPSKITDLSGDVREIQRQTQSLQDELSGKLNDVPAKLKTLRGEEHKPGHHLPALSRKFSKNAEKAKLKQPATKTPPTFQSPFSPSPSSSLSQNEGESIKKDKGKATMSSKNIEEEEYESDFEDDYVNPADPMVESSRKRKAKKFDFVMEKGEYVHLTAEMIKEQERIEESLEKGPITLKVYREDGTNEVIPNFKTSNLNLAEWREIKQICPNQEERGWKAIFKQVKPKLDLLHQAEAKLKIDTNKPLNEQDPLDELNTLANKKRKGADDLYESFRSTKRQKKPKSYRATETIKCNPLY